MFFNSLTYILFLPIVWLVFQVSPARWRWLVLLVASLGFYAALKAPYLPVVLAAVALVSYVAGLRMAAQPDEAGRKRWLWGGVVVNILTLAFMKYLPALFVGGQPVSSSFVFILSIGVSYFVFQAVSYLADIYLEIIEPEPHFGYLLLSLAFFPKLLQGPIERSGDLLPQLRMPYRFDYDNLRLGLFMFLCGLFKKVVIADRLGLFIDQVYNNVHAFTGLPLLTATYFYALQVYFDFSGYTDMALGSARLFNINLTQNFNRPYLAVSVSDFWRRWHISFSRWILDYIFKPLQMQWRDGRNWGTAAALVVTFLVSGIWHGASWGFVVWGGLHGLYMACSVFWRPYQKKLHKTLGLEKSGLLRLWQIFVTFNLVSFAWIFFRANSLQDAGYVASRLFSGSVSVGAKVVLTVLTGSNLSIYNSLVLVVSFFCILVARLARDRFPIFQQQAWFRWGIYFMLTLWVLLFQSEGSADFLYLRF